MLTDMPGLTLCTASPSVTLNTAFAPLAPAHGTPCCQQRRGQRRNGADIKLESVHALLPKASIEPRIDTAHRDATSLSANGGMMPSARRATARIGEPA